MESRDTLRVICECGLQISIKEVVTRHVYCMYNCLIILLAGGGNQMDGWSGAGQRDYHYSMYNKRTFEEVHGINLDML